MTRVLSEGFEMQDLVGYSGYGNVSINGTYKRSGNVGLLFSEANFYLPFTAIAEGYFRLGYYYISGNATTNKYILIQWRSGTTVLGYIKIDYLASGFPNVVVPGVSSTFGTTILGAGYWYLIEIHIKIDDATGEIKVKIDGNDEITVSGDTKPDANATFDNIFITFSSIGGVGNTLYWAIDDLALNDTAGAVDNSWCGDGKIIVLKPNGDTATLDLTPSAAVDHYTLVEDIPADGDTTYVESSVDDEEDIYDLAACGLGEVIITRIWSEARAKDTAASGLKVALITKASGGAEVSGGDITLTNSYTTKVLGAAELVNPVDSAAWEVADLDALQGGPRKRS